MGTDSPTTAISPQRLLEDLAVPFEPNAPLAPRTWYGLGGPAQFLAHPQSTPQLGQLLARCRAANIPLRVLGSGANLLIADAGVTGIVITLDAPAFRAIAIQGDTVTASAGADLAKLIQDTVHAGLSGLEALAGIPSSLGGAIRMNAGGRFGEIGPLVESLTVLTPDGTPSTLDRANLRFSYRHSEIPIGSPPAALILAATLRLTPTDPAPLRQRMIEIFRYKKDSQPLGARSAGCAFKNPPPSATDKSAGRLIDESGLKGYRVGGASVSQVHANFVVVDPGATAADVLAVMTHMQKTVLEKTGVKLEREVVTWGFE